MDFVRSVKNHYPLALIVEDGPLIPDPRERKPDTSTRRAGLPLLDFRSADLSLSRRSKQALDFQAAIDKPLHSRVSLLNKLEVKRRGWRTRRAFVRFP